MATQRDGAISPKSTPEGVPPDYNYLPPGEDPPDGHDVVESPAGGTYISPEPTDGEDDDGSGVGGVSEEDREFVTETGESLDEMADFNDESGFVDPPKTIDSVSAGDRLGIMRPDTFQFEAAVVEEVMPDTGEVRVLSSADDGGPETVTIGARDIVRGYDSAGDEFAQRRQADLRSQVDSVSKDELREALPRDTGSNFGEQIMADDFDERFSDVDMSDTDAVVDELRELIQDWEDHYAVDLSPALDEVSNRLSAQGNPPDRDGLTGFEYDLPTDDTGFETGLDEVTGTEFDDDHERSIAVQRFLEDRIDFDGPVEVPAVDPESQRSFGSAVKLADETGELDNLRHSVRTARPGENGMSFGWYDGAKIHMKNDLSNEKVAINEETGVADTLGEVFLHEVGHAVHDSATEGTISVLQFEQPEIENVEDKVSKYAETNMSEFIAETYLAQWKGGDLPDEVLDEYEEWGGPEPPDDPIDFEASFESIREIRDMVRETIPDGIPAMYAEEAFATVEGMIEESPDVSAEDFADTIETAATPEGVPDGYNYLSPGEEPPDDHDVVTSPQGATYVSPQPVESDNKRDEGGGTDTDENDESVDVDPYTEAVFNDAPDAGPSELAGGIAAAIDDDRDDFHAIRNAIVDADSRGEALNIIDESLGVDERKRAARQVEEHERMREEFDRVENVTDLEFGQRVLADGERPVSGYVDDVDADGTVWVNYDNRDLTSGRSVDQFDIYAEPDGGDGQAAAIDLTQEDGGRFGLASSDKALENPFDAAQDVVGAREAGITDGNTTGGKMKIAELPDGSRIFATPVNAYQYATTGVVDGPEDARRANLAGPKVIDAFGGRSAKTRATEYQGDEYIVKEGIDGDLHNDRREGTQLSDSESESLERTLAAAYFAGNKDLHGANVMIGDDGEAYVIDHDSQTTATDPRSVDRLWSPGTDIPSRVADLSREFAEGEIELPDDIDDQTRRVVQTQVQQAAKEYGDRAFDDFESPPGEAFTPDEDLKEGETVAYLKEGEIRRAEASGGEQFFDIELRNPDGDRPETITVNKMNVLGREDA